MTCVDVNVRWLCFCFTVVFDVYRDSEVSTLMHFDTVHFKIVTRKLSHTSVCVCVCVLQGRVWLIDLNPFGALTDSLLFSWEELRSGGEISQQQVSFHDTLSKNRLHCAELHKGSEENQSICSDCELRPLLNKSEVQPVLLWLYFSVQEGPAFRCTTSEVTVQPSPCLSYRIPRDFVDLSTGEDAYKLMDFLKLVRVEDQSLYNTMSLSIMLHKVMEQDKVHCCSRTLYFSLMLNDKDSSEHMFRVRVRHLSWGKLCSIFELSKKSIY